MNCPRCGSRMVNRQGNSYHCHSCSYMGTSKEVLELAGGLREINARIETKKAELECLSQAMRYAKVRGNSTYLQPVLASNSQSPNNPRVGSDTNPTTTRRSRFSSKVGIMIASLELGGFIGWFLENCNALAEGKISQLGVIIPLVFMFQGLILLLVSWK